MSNVSRLRSLLRRSAVLALLLMVVVALAGAGWIAYTQRARSLRETKTVEQLAAGKGRWVQVADAELYVQEWGRPTDPVLLLTHGTGAWSGTWFGFLMRWPREAGVSWQSTCRRSV